MYINSVKVILDLVCTKAGENVIIYVYVYIVAKLIVTS